jgi:hypothetical protein
MSELYWFKFFPKDFMGDMNLKRCSHEAVGVYIKFLCLAFDCDESGVFISGGVPWSKDEVIYALGGNYEATQKAFDELIKWKLIKIRETDGAYFNSRMVRDDEERSSTRDRVRKHRASNRDVTPDVTPHVTPHVTDTVTPDVTVQILDIRDKSIEIKKEEELEREKDARAREEKIPLSNFYKKIDFSDSENSSKSESEEPPPSSAAPPHNPSTSFKDPPIERNGKPLFRDDEILKTLLEDQVYVETCMIGSNVRTMDHLKEVAELYKLNERKKQDADYVLMTRPEAANGLLGWVKRERPKKPGMKVYDEKKSFNSHADFEERKFQKAAEYQRKRNEGIS